MHFSTAYHRGDMIEFVKVCNSLPEEVVTAPTVQCIEARLDKAWNDQPLMFYYKEDLI